MDLQKLRARLATAGLTQADVAERLDRTRFQVSRLLSGKTRMHVETLAAIEALLAEAEGARRGGGVGETPTTPYQHGIRFVTLEEAKKGDPVRLSETEQAQVMRALREIGEAGKRLPRVTDMSDDEILGYDE